MSQHDYIVANADGATVRADINDALAAIVGLNAGATAPATMYAYMLWADTTTGLLKIRNAANSAWITLGTLASTGLGIGPAASETVAGIVELATSAEVATGSDTGRAVTAAGLLANYIGQGRHTIWMPATAMVARTTNGAAAGTAEMTTNKNMFKTLDFDATTQEFAQFAIRMPKGWNEGTVAFVPEWSHPATATNFGVVWSLAGVAISNDDAGDVAFGTEQTSTDTGGTTNDLYVGPESAAITIAGTPAAEDYVMFQIKRNVSDGSDTLAVDARLHGITLYFTIDARNDA